jgi:sigma factor-binding protein Crl
MTSEFNITPSRGRFFKLFTDLGPYFRKQQSTESRFFFDCLEICVEPEKEPEQREFYGWWLILLQEESVYRYQRFDGRYNLAGDWVVESLSVENKQQVDKSFELFFTRLEALIKDETGLELKEKEPAVVEPPLSAIEM